MSSELFFPFRFDVGPGLFVVCCALKMRNRIGVFCSVKRIRVMDLS